MNYQVVKKYSALFLLITMPFQALPISDMDLFAHIARADVKAVKKHIQIDTDINKQLGDEQETAAMRVVKHMVEIAEDSKGKTDYGVRLGLENTAQGLGLTFLGTLGLALTVGEFLTINADPNEIDKLKDKKAGELREAQLKQLLAIVDIKKFSIPQLFTLIYKVLRPDEEAKPAVESNAVQPQANQPSVPAPAPTDSNAPATVNSNTNVNVNVNVNPLNVNVNAPGDEPAGSGKDESEPAPSTPKKKTAEPSAKAGVLESAIKWGAQGVTNAIVSAANLNDDVKEKVNAFANENLPKALDQLPIIGQNAADTVTGAKKVFSDKNAQSVENSLGNIEKATVGFIGIGPEAKRTIGEFHHLFNLIVTFVCAAGGILSVWSLGKGLNKTFKGIFKEVAGKPFHVIARNHKIKCYKTIFTMLLSRENLDLSKRNKSGQTLREMVHQLMLDNLDNEPVYNVLHELDALIDDRTLVIGAGI